MNNTIDRPLRTAVIGDNEGYAGHRAGYNGVHRLTHRTQPRSHFTVTGLNLEHIFTTTRTCGATAPSRSNPEAHR